MSLQAIKTRIASLFGTSFLAHFTFRFSGYPTFPMIDFYKIIDAIKENGPGIYAFSSTDTKALAGKIIRAFVKGGKYSHSGLILADDYRETHILHMKGNGLNYDHLLSLLREVDYLTVVKLPVSDLQKATRRIQDVLDHQDLITYDYETKLANGNKLYCSELIHLVCNGLVDDPDFKESLIAGRKIFDPDAVIKSGNIIYSNLDNF